MRIYKKDIFEDCSFHVAETVLTNSMPTFSHCHDFYEITIIKSGFVNHIINDTVAFSRPDMLFFIHPEDEHYFKKAGASAVQFINLAFSKQIFEKALCAYSSRNNKEVEFEKLQRIVFLPSGLSQLLISRILWISSDCNFFENAIKEDFLADIILDVIATIVHQNTAIQSVPHWLSYTCDMMGREENYMLGLSRFIELSGKSQEHLTRMMKQHYHQTPTAYLNSIKLQEATKKLISTSDNILDIIYDSGFSSPSYFSKLFKNKYNMTPREYRVNNETVLHGLK